MANAGRPRKIEKNIASINQAEGRIKDRLPELIDNLFHLANGGYEKVTCEYQPAGILTVGKGENERLLFPDKPKDELVLVKKTISIADKDRTANVYLLDRVLGKPVQKVAETDSAGNDLNERPARETIASKLNSLSTRQSEGETSS